MDALLEEWVADGLVERLAAAGGVGVKTISGMLRAGAGTHDVGKAGPVFQGQLLSSRPPEGIVEHRAVLAGSGLSMSPPSWAGAGMSLEEQWWIRRHEVGSAVWANGAVGDAGGQHLSAVVAGHHGRWRIPDGYDIAQEVACGYYGWWLTDLAWTAARDQVLQIACSTTGIAPAVRLADHAVVPMLTSLVVLADWLASDLADRDPTSPADGDWGGHADRRRDQAAESVRELLGVPFRPKGGFDGIFGFPPSRPVQQAMVGSAKPGLRIVMVPTGDGKTEAAVGHWLINAAERQGLFFALPTMATADAMFDRVREVFRDSDATTGVLVHGRSILNQFYAQVERPLQGDIHGEAGTGLQPGRWFTGNSRAALAPVTVGTIDQALLSVLRHRYNTLRLLGLATKTVVLDEVHSYDPYMEVLLERFLNWAAKLGIDVVLLSATLPTERVRAYQKAYGATPIDAGYPSVVTVINGTAVVEVLEASDRATTIDLVHHRITDPVGDTVAVIRQLRQDYPAAKIGVIVNTVGRCQDIARALSVDEPVDVMHARFPAGMRGRQVQAAISRYGKASVGGAAVMVATQVVEQSIDLDFDLLVSDLCPAPSLVQRAGRAFRHLHDPARRVRPAGIANPIVHVLVTDPFPSGPMDWLPYPTAIIRKSWEVGLQSGGRTTLAVPSDVQGFVDDAHVVYADAAAADAHDLLLQVAVMKTDATRRVIPTPDQLTGDPIRFLEDYATGVQDTGEFQTRWIDDHSVDVLLCNGGPDTWTALLPSRPSRQQVRDLLACVVPLAGAARRAVDPDLQTPDDAGLAWDGTHLADVQVLDLSSTPHHLDPSLGFIHGSRS